MSASEWFDAIVIGLIVIFALKYLTSGVIRELFGITGVIGGIYFAIRYKAEAGAWVSQNVYDITKNGSVGIEGTEVLVGFLAVLFGFWIVCLILGEILSKLINLSGLGFLNRLGGAIFGVAKIFLILSVIVALTQGAVMLNKQTKPYVENSKVYPYLLKFGTMILGDLNFMKMDFWGDKITKNTSEDTNITNLDSNESNETNINKIIIFNHNQTTGGTQWQPM